MSYRIGWRWRVSNYVQQLIHVAEEAGRADGAAEALEQVIADLESRPGDVGESRDDPERVLIVSPFAVFYEVFETSRTVLVYRVHYRGYPKLNV